MNWWMVEENKKRGGNVVKNWQMLNLGNPEVKSSKKVKWIRPFFHNSSYAKIYFITESSGKKTSDNF